MLAGPVTPRLGLGRQHAPAVVAAGRQLAPPWPGVRPDWKVPSGPLRRTGLRRLVRWRVQSGSAGPWRLGYMAQRAAGHPVAGPR